MPRHATAADRDLAREVLTEDMMLGANHMLDALNSGLTVADAWEYTQAMCRHRAEQEHLTRDEPLRLRAEYVATRQAIRDKHKVGDWGVGLSRCGDRTLAR